MNGSAAFNSIHYLRFSSCFLYFMCLLFFIFSTSSSCRMEKTKRHPTPQLRCPKLRTLKGPPLTRYSDYHHSASLVTLHLVREASEEEGHWHLVGIKAAKITLQISMFSATKLKSKDFDSQWAWFFDSLWCLILKWIGMCREVKKDEPPKPRERGRGRGDGTRGGRNERGRGRGSNVIQVSF